MDEAEKKRVFEGNDIVSRFKFIDKLYRKWVELKRNGECGVDIYEIIDTKLDEMYSVDSYLNDFRYIVSTNRDALGYDDLEHDDDGKEDDDLQCDINDCFVVKRSERDRAMMSKNEQERNSLFFVSTAMEEDGASRHSVVLQQILDTAHVWHCHTLRVKADKYIDEKLSDRKDDKEDIDWSCTDALVQNFKTLIEKKKESSNRFRNTQNEQTTSKATKFTTMSIEDAEALTNSVTTNDHKKDTKNKVTSFQEEILEEVRNTVVSTSDIEDFYEFIEEEQFDTEALNDDLKKYQDSNIMHKFGARHTRNGKGLQWILRKLLFECKQRRNAYSSGFRFFYWSHYQHREEEWHHLLTLPTGHEVVEGNEGFKICDFYVAPKWTNLKEEALNNTSCSFSRRQFNDLLEKATAKLKSWNKDPKARKLTALGDLPAFLSSLIFCDKAFGIKHCTPIKVEHIIALLMYTDFDQHSRLFSASFRKSSPYETVADLVERHRQYYHWGKLLRELIEAYGEWLVFSQIKYLYHGVSAELLFDSLQLFGPVSTTASLCTFLLFMFQHVLRSKRIFVGLLTKLDLF